MAHQYKRTRYACYIGYITQAIVNNLLPLLFVIFQTGYGLSYRSLGGLILLNFVTQLCVDAIGARYADKWGFRAPMVVSHIFCTVGLCMLAAAPFLPIPIYGALVFAVVLYAIGGGLLEVLVSPLVDSLPAADEEKGANMSLLHSFYCWGQVGVVAFSTLLLAATGTRAWPVLPLLWAMIPLFNTVMFTKVPLPQMLADDKRVPLRSLFAAPAFIAAMIAMFCSGSSELTVSQWSSMLAERGLGVSKMWGDLAGPCLFALLMGAGRMVYGVWGARIRLSRFMALLTSLCIVCYLVIALSPYPALSLAACAVCGFAVSVMWPGVFSLTSARFPLGGTAMFAVLAMCGDLGASVGPWLAGVVADATTMGGSLHGLGSAIFSGGDAGLKAGIMVTVIFPVTLLLILPVFRHGAPEGDAE